MRDKMNEPEASKKAQEILEYSTWMLEANETQGQLQSQNDMR